MLLQQKNGLGMPLFGCQGEGGSASEILSIDLRSSLDQKRQARYISVIRRTHQSRMVVLAADMNVCPTFYKKTNRVGVGFCRPCK